jgi:hypothetical protein
MGYIFCAKPELFQKVFLPQAAPRGSAVIEKIIVKRQTVLQYGEYIVDGPAICTTIPPAGTLIPAVVE